MKSNITGQNFASATNLDNFLNITSSIVSEHFYQELYNIIGLKKGNLNFKNIMSPNNIFEKIKVAYPDTKVEDLKNILTFPGGGRGRNIFGIACTGKPLNDGRWPPMLSSSSLPRSFKLIINPPGIYETCFSYTTPVDDNVVRDFQKFVIQYDKPPTESTPPQIFYEPKRYEHRIDTYGELLVKDNIWKIGEGHEAASVYFFHNPNNESFDGGTVYIDLVGTPAGYTTFGWAVMYEFYDWDKYVNWYNSVSWDDDNDPIISSSSPTDPRQPVPSDPCNPFFNLSPGSYDLKVFGENHKIVVSSDRTTKVSINGVNRSVRIEGGVDPVIPGPDPVTPTHPDHSLYQSYHSITDPPFGNYYCTSNNIGEIDESACPGQKKVTRFIDGGFKEQYNINDPKIAIHQEEWGTQELSDNDEFRLSRNLTHIPRSTEELYIPDFRVYIPPGVTYFSFIIFISGGATGVNVHKAICVRVGKPPTDIRTINSDSEYTNFTFNNPNQYILSKLENENHYLQNAGGSINIFSGGPGANFVAGKWLYVRTIFGQPQWGRIELTARVNVGEYRKWYNSAKWDPSNGDPI